MADGAGGVGRRVPHIGGATGASGDKRNRHVG